MRPTGSLASFAAKSCGLVFAPINNFVGLTKANNVDSLKWTPEIGPPVKV
jgi:hypothetical protein